MKLLLYCTKAKPYLYGMYCGIFCDRVWRNFTTNDKNVFNKHTVLNGKIVGECDYEVEKIESKYLDSFYSDLNEICKESCLSIYELLNYASKDKIGFEVSFYAIHIKNLIIYDKPKELSDFTHATTSYNGARLKALLQKAPQSMCYVYDKGEHKILISIRPEWLCKILNGEKTIEVRRKVLKEMIK